MVAIDILGTVVVGFVAILTAVSGKEYLLNVAIVWALISFVGTLGPGQVPGGEGLHE